MIRLRDVSVSFGRRPILTGITLEVESGGWTCLIGPNGSGKTTLLRAVAGLVPFTGRVEVCGEDVRDVPRRRLARMVAYVPQKPVIPEGMRVGDYVLLGRSPYIPYFGTERAGDVAVAREVLEQVGILLLSGRPLGTLSGGELQRAVLARALAQRSQVLLLDEPTTGLDVGHQQQLLELIDSLRAAEGLTILSAIHDLTLAAQFPERLVLLDGGVAVASGPPAELLTEELVSKHYGARVVVVDGDGSPAVVPIRDKGRVRATGRPRS